MLIDRRKPVQGPNMGVEVVNAETEGIDYFFVKNKARVTVNKPVAVRLKREGGSYYMVEFFYRPNEGPRGMEIYDGKSLVVTDHGFIQPPQIFKRIAHVVKRLGVIGVDI